jgi:hypothetical protein
LRRNQDLGIIATPRPGHGAAGRPGPRAGRRHAAFRNAGGSILFRSRRCNRSTSLAGPGPSDRDPQRKRGTPAPADGLPAGKWTAEFANGVVETCEIKKDGTTSVVEPRRTAGGKVTARDGAFVIACEDDRLERWTPVGKRMVVEHWFPASQVPVVTPVLGIAERAQ